MTRSRWSRGVRLGMVGLLVALVTAPGALAVHGVPTKVTVGSNDDVLSQNRQNEPAVAVDAAHPDVLAAGANDDIDLEACNAGDPTTCPWTPGVGDSGVQFSFDSGDSWIQPTYTGWTARHCVGAPGFTCTPGFGPIGTLPWYYEEGLMSGGDPAVAFGPRPDASGNFRWANGSRLYFANLTSNFSPDREREAFEGLEAIAVSRIDGDPALTPAIVANKESWMRPVIASQRQTSTTSADKPQIWADNAASSPFFGNLYVCFVQFLDPQGEAAPLMVTRSTDGGDTWRQRRISPAANTLPRRWGQSGCTIRTDSRGTVYVFYEQFQSPFVFMPPRGTHMLVQSFDGGRSWTRHRALFQATDPCYFVEPVTSVCVMDGIAGARNDLSAAPSADIANGAPTGVGATNQIVRVWADGGDGLNDEQVKLSYSVDRATSWSNPVAIQNAGHRGFYAAPALSPNGSDLYVVYNAFTTPFRDETTSPRSLIGVVKHADIGGRGAPTNWTTLHTTPPGDARGSTRTNLDAEFLGDYVYAAATRTFGAALWNDARNAAVCPAINAYWAALRGGPAAPRPAPQIDCPSTWGNTDIFGGSWTDPTPWRRKPRGEERRHGRPSASAAWTRSTSQARRR
jgi:hypothetical protein